MERIIRNHRKHLSQKHRSTPYPTPSNPRIVSAKGGNPKETSLLMERRDWKCATCSVCLEFPHNAVLLLCSSHDNGCRPYMCGTGYRYSNCLEQFKKSYSQSVSSQHELGVEATNHNSPEWKKPEVVDLKCPLCRGQVKGWTVVEPARKYLNKKKRGCLQENCSFIGNYKQLRKHVKAEHPCAKPRAVDPVLEQKWKMLENQRERADVISTIRSSMPRSIVFGDYVIDMDDHDSDPEFDNADGDNRFDDASVIFGRGNSRTSRHILYAFLREAARRRLAASQVQSSREAGSGGAGTAGHGPPDGLSNHLNENDADETASGIVISGRHQQQHRARGRWL